MFRPADANEVAESYRAILSAGHQPAAVVLTRQALPTLDRTRYASASQVARGGYTLVETADQTPKVILMGTGSEVTICLEAFEQLQTRGVAARVVSLPCFELFEAQDPAYRESVLPSTVTARVGVEAGIIQGWERYLGPSGRFVGMSGFGASAPFETLYEHFGITVEAVIAAAKTQLESA